MQIYSLFCYPQTGEKYKAGDVALYPISSLRVLAQEQKENMGIPCVGAGTILKHIVLRKRIPIHNRPANSVFQYGRESVLTMGIQSIRSEKVQILVKHSAR